MGIKPGSAEFHRLKKGFIPTYDRWGRPIAIDDDLRIDFPNRGKGPKGTALIDHPGRSGGDHGNGKDHGNGGGDHVNQGHGGKQKGHGNSGHGKPTGHDVGGDHGQGGKGKSGKGHGKG
jgi:hypothetical protein